MQEKLNDLKLKKAMLWSQIQMLSSVSDLMYINFGKVEADIMLLELQIVRESKNNFTNES